LPPGPSTGLYPKEEQVAREQTLVLLGQNLIFMPRIMNAAQAAGLTTHYANSRRDFWALFEERLPELVLVDLESDSELWTEVLAELQARDHDVRVVAFGQHTDTESLERARELGCGSVLTKGEFSRDMQRVIAGDA
jgi:DNA-binding NtrC family response regulator